MSKLLLTIIFLCILQPDITNQAAMDSSGGCFYQFQVWAPSEDVLKRIENLEFLCNNSSKSDLEMLEMRNRTLLLERDITHLKSWREENDTSDEDYVTTSYLENKLAQTQVMSEQLKNWLAEMKGEWMLIKRQIHGLRRARDDDLTASDTTRLKDELRAIRNKIDDHIAERHAGHGGDVHRNSHSRGLKELESKFSHALDRLKHEVHYLRDAMAHPTNHITSNVTSRANVSSEFINGFAPSLPHLTPLSLIPPRDCHDVYSAGYRSSGEFEIRPDHAFYKIPVYCRMDHDAGWTVIQRRVDGSLSFSRPWLQYKFGFGNIFGEFWLGNEWIYLLTQQRRYKLRVDMWDWEGGRYDMEYSQFSVRSEAHAYSLKLGMSEGDAGDSLSVHANISFSTPDVDNDLSPEDCAAKHQSGWWFNSCISSNLNGVYRSGYYEGKVTDPDGIVWFTLKNSNFYSLRKVEMLIKPV